MNKKRVIDQKFSSFELKNECGKLLKVIGGDNRTWTDCLTYVSDGKGGGTYVRTRTEDPPTTPPIK
jgi:hypothetical protein